MTTFSPNQAMVSLLEHYPQMKFAKCVSIEFSPTEAIQDQKYSTVFTITPLKTSYTYKNEIHEIEFNEKIRLKVSRGQPFKHFDRSRPTNTLQISTTMKMFMTPETDFDESKEATYYPWRIIF